MRPGFNTTPTRLCGRNSPLLVPLLLAALLAGCASTPDERLPRTSRVGGPVIKAPPTGKAQPGLPNLPPANSGRGGYYQDDGPGDNPPANLAAVPDAEVRNDPLLPRSNRPYVVLGKTYTPITDDEPFTQVGMGTWYGKKFHGQRTSSGELYDMYKMTAAHPTLPIPSYARVSNMLTGATVVVRINDRGPFHAKRVIDVSYTAALKLGLLNKGSHELKVERILPAEIDRMLATRGGVSTTSGARLVSQATQSSPDKRLNSYRGDDEKPALVLAPRAVPANPEIEALMLGDGATTATAAAAAVPATPATQDEALTGGYYLQLGAYSRPDGARELQGQLAGATLAALHMVQSGPVFRLFSGPFASRQSAQDAIANLPSALKLKPLVIQR
ncbi:septal ring lytic transglycosylase RlpA family protein [Duganella phyllosphaerae]|uniref:Endolytic peptidoglycan transglycosylase RlpA n=1 Tax=Duganella phyllosphaerae TaxID=762836 RepID=A0A1E7W7K7_9BURK|nr:septal ring lytic transglycosylase RlpA family protein [Duganella phyllosphaerae]OEZ92066.1 RlpA-like protein precursor [Duganella phyllosphaerae]